MTRSGSAGGSAADAATGLASNEYGPGVGKPQAQAPGKRPAASSGHRGAAQRAPSIPRTARRVTLASPPLINFSFRGIQPLLSPSPSPRWPSPPAPRSRGLLWLGVGPLACALVGKQWAWPWYVEFSLQKLGWENVYNRCSTLITERRVPYTWPLQYKPEWKKVKTCGLTVRDATDLARAKHIEELDVCGAIAPGALAPLARLPRLSHLRIFVTCPPSTSPHDAARVR